MGTTLGIRGLHKTKGSNITVGTDVPSNAFGNSGDIAIRNVDGAIRLYAKYGGEWYGRDLGPTLVVGDVNRKHTIMDSNGVQIKDGRGKTVSRFADDIHMFGRILLTSTGTRNICIGLNNADNGDDNIAIGSDAGANYGSDSAGNISIGTNAGKEVTGLTARNIAIGTDTLKNLDATGGTVPFDNTAIGHRAMLNSDSGISNVAIGTNAMGGAVGSYLTRFNVAIGMNSLGETTLENAEGNVCVGAGAGQNMTDGDRNICVGKFAGKDITDGADNICIGGLNSDTLIGGADNIIIGTGADVDSSSADHRISIGEGVSATSDKHAYIGDGTNSASLDFSSSGNSWSTTSDERIKRNIQDTDLGLSFIKKLRAIKYQDKATEDWPSDFKIQNPSSKANNTWIDGLSAQAVKTAADELRVEFSGYENDGGVRRLQYSKFIVPLIKAVQELSDKVDTLEGYHVGR
jgi:hypothetical protein